ncbi:UDP-glycosyltransferase UGT5-like [Leptidea sinapis]|uniref:UDP-glycosyltransferase UGT5-like n=1 Tax=Leptidea sinapis TaxID=189913 RepID=UPI0021C35E38|nr:UDP-glycosyltransferase UGT5-like [Leptidea sinapis]
MYGTILDALVQRHHNLTVITHFPKNYAAPNIKEISLAGTIKDLSNNLTRQRNTLKPNFIFNLEALISECIEACQVVSQQANIRALLNTTDTYDLVIIEVFGSDCFLPFGKLFNAPVVGLLSSVPLPWVNDQLGNPEIPSYIPAYVTGFSQSMSLWERFSNTLSILLAKILYHYKSQVPSQVIADNLFGPGYKLDELAQNYSLVLSNSHFSINEVRPLVPTLIEVGGVHLNDKQIMSKDLRTVLDSAHEGVIYWSFGSMSRIETIPKDKLKQMFAVIAELPQLFLVKMNRSMMPGNITIPENILPMEWIPQYKTLCHPNVKVFISHGGLLGTQEAVACATPMLIVPLFADQALNARAMRERGVARSIALADVTENSWRDVLHDLITNDRYKTSALLLRDKFMDRPMPPLETSVYWIEYVLRHKGATHLRSPALELSFIQYLLLDVVALSLAIFLTTTFILHKIFRYLCIRCIRCLPKQEIIEKRLFRRNNIRLFHCFIWVYKLKTN